MRSRLFVFAAVILCFSITQVAAQKNKPNPEITKMVKEVSAKNIEATIRKLVSFGTRNTLSEQDSPTRGVGAARDWLFAEFQKISADCGGCLDVQKQAFVQPKANRVSEPTTLTNVFAVLKGTTDPTRIYVVSGHYDSMCGSPTDAKCDAPGANDDASGTAVSLELARVMSKQKYDATIVFMAVPGEEQGLLGATYYAEQAKLNKTNIDAMFTNDIVGGAITQKGSINRNKVRVFSEGVPSSETEQQANTRRSVGGENDSASRQLARFIKEQSSRYLKNFGVMMIYRRDRYLRGGDHIPFVERGFTAVRITESDEDYTHQHQNVRTENGVFYGDTPEFVDFEYTANVARVNLIALASLALAPAKPANVGIVTSKLTNDTELKWDANTDADLAGYEVVWRDTTAAEWTNSIFVGNVLTYAAKGMSKDNYFFGVRAVDKAGNKSPVVYPRPMR
ncbi:MAG TPA: M28 family metallopeptidase [Pyrinomonadaceae bacterium]|nr:M28 family metallopeptidase [Pyrinomonadaceae bacterium]HQY66263.1 M28 family metallopeptidase [Pyrinomonadaceae bacterium]HRA41214.1 M28 family metallopeptidase [Pyrinomonadaceae bacterium]